ncbi:hypothetical protein HYDPIDRAFT_92498 [Hydnomerulius pinastri MD-312]|uniref:Bacteriophage T5 Orf172 DNA-binding domain-containing protein n=1 Tax=Hydnomerulius pinastri MD-312 TaxID=994086 RepID=A0A0C9VY75_9AGAM|nr:hypothetical protein HYDPIDRAFT_92498 [Hydnomerulius pinastri MD-312]
MEKPPSPADTPGYIYAYEIRDPLAPDVLQLKVGRTASNINERLAQWDKQCPSKETITRGIWPEPIASKGRDTFFSLLKHNIPQKNLKPGIYHRRVERLAHIELRDLAEYAPYLSSEKSSNITLRSPAQACTDCGKVHKEIFTFRLAEDGKYKGAEWQKLVKPVIERWGRFVEEYDA